MHANSHPRGAPQRLTTRRPTRSALRVVTSSPRPPAAFRQRGRQSGLKLEDFTAPERWHAPKEDGRTRFIVEAPGPGFRHAVTLDEVRERIARLPEKFTRNLDVVQLSAMTRKRQLFPNYGMQWGTAVYLYPIEDSLVEIYHHPPTPQQRIEAGMFGGVWSQSGRQWQLAWTDESIRDFYLNNVLIHEIGHVNDVRNTNSRDRERFANWFAIEYGYRPTR